LPEVFAVAVSSESPIFKTMTAIASFIQSIKLPVMPEVAHALIRTLNDPKADVTMVSRVISKDPALTATLLRMANSAIFGLSHSVSTLDNAVTVVGLAHIRARALSICIANAFVLPPSLSRIDFWRDSMVCAGYSQWLASKVGVDVQQAWLAGMMLRLGEIAIAQKRPQAIDDIERLPREPGERWIREVSNCGFDEGQITAEIVRRWDFPETLSDALDYATQPMASTRFSKLGGVVHLGALLAQQTKGDPAPWQALPPKVLKALDLDIETIRIDFPNADSFSDTSMLMG
jgi:HD-like signal output (HDOD) protein